MCLFSCLFVVYLTCLHFVLILMCCVFIIVLCSEGDIFPPQTIRDLSSNTSFVFAAIGLDQKGALYVSLCFPLCMFVMFTFAFSVSYLMWC